jgi:hypothetical protein
LSFATLLSQHEGLALHCDLEALDVATDGLQNVGAGLAALPLVVDEGRDGDARTICELLLAETKPAA